MSAIEKLEQAALKHLQGKHNQKRHGWRYTGDALANARSAMRGQSAGERGEYRKRAGMVEPKKVGKPKVSNSLPKIVGGTEKQNSYAESIRTRIMSEAKGFKLTEKGRKALALIKKQTKPEWWIYYKSRSAATLILDIAAKHPEF